MQIKYMFFHNIFFFFLLVFLPFNSQANEKNGLLVQDLPYQLTIHSDELKHIYFTLVNQSKHRLKNIEITFVAPEEWLVQASPRKINKLEIGQQQEIELLCHSPRLFFNKNFTLLIFLQSDEFSIQRYSIDIRAVAIKNFWPLAGIVTAFFCVIILISVYLFFRRFK